MNVFENTVLRRLFRSEIDELIGDWRRMLNEELHNLTFSPNALKISKLRRLEWAEHVAHMGEDSNYLKFW